MSYSCALRGPGARGAREGPQKSDAKFEIVRAVRVFGAHRTARPADGNAAPQRRSYDEGVSIEVCNTLANRTEAEILKKLGRL